MIQFTEDVNSPECDSVHYDVPGKIVVDVNSPGCDKVHYQAPGDLKVENDPTPDVVHDDSLPIDTQDDSVPSPEDLGFEIPKQDDLSTAKPSPVITPVDAIRQTKANPSTVTITKFGDKYYIDHNDLRCYMDACGEHNYESAVRNIINAHEDADLTNDNIGIVLGENDLFNLDPETKTAMESSNVSFEVYN